MIRVRYKDQLSPGLHGKAERSADGTTVYLVPGLTRGQRKAALRRLRLEASRGCGPALPGADLTVALAADRFRTGLRNTTAVIRLHPAGSLLPAALAGLLMALFVLASVSAGIIRLPQAAPPGGLLPGGGAPTVVGVPALARGNRNPHSAHKAGVHQNTSNSLVSSPGTGTPPPKPTHPGKVPVTVCGGANGDSGSCTATPTPMPPPPAGWPSWQPVPSS